MSLELVNTLATLGTFLVIGATATAAIIQLRHMRGSNQIVALNELGNRSKPRSSRLRLGSSLRDSRRLSKTRPSATQSATRSREPTSSRSHHHKASRSRELLRIPWPSRTFRFGRPGPRAQLLGRRDHRVHVEKAGAGYCNLSAQARFCGF